MTPLELRHKLFSNHIYDKTIKKNIRRESSLTTVQDAAMYKMKNGEHINDTIRRESSFYKKHVDNVNKIYMS